MGEVRAKVKLTNAVDEELVRRGLIAAAEMRVYETEALVDTGAVSSVISFRKFLFNYGNSKI